MKIPWTAKSVFGVGRHDAVGATVEDLQLADLDDRPLGVLDCAPGTTAFAVVVTVQVLPIAVLAVAAQGVITGNGMSITVAASGPPPGATALQWSVMRIVAVPCELTGVVRAVGRVGSATCGHAGLTADVRGARRDVHVGVLRRTRRTDHHAELDEPDRVRRGTVRVGRADRQRSSTTGPAGYTTGTPAAARACGSVSRTR